MLKLDIIIGIIGIFLALMLTYFLYSHPIDSDVKVEKEIHPVVKLTVKSAPTSHSSAVHIGDGYFFTSAHAIPENEEIIYAQPQTYDERVEIELLWTAPNYDVALLYASDLSRISNYSLSCNKLTVGQELEFHGNPQSQKSISTWGKVAGTKRDLEKYDWKEAIPVSGNIVTGMSGGSVTNNQNELVGINAGFFAHPINPYSYSMTGISFIIPSSTLCKLLNKS